MSVQPLGCRPTMSCVLFFRTDRRSARISTAHRAPATCRTHFYTFLLCFALSLFRKLEKILSGGSQSDTKLKHLTGEWFYEAKSRRHADKIHGSEIIIASMKQRKAAGLGGFTLIVTSGLTLSSTRRRLHYVARGIFFTTQKCHTLLDVMLVSPWANRANHCWVQCCSSDSYKLCSVSLLAADGSLRMERTKTPGCQGSAPATPPKPARCLEALQPQQIKYTSHCLSALFSCS